MATGPLSMPCSSCGQLTRTVVEQIGSGPAICRRYSDQTGHKVQGAQEVLAAAQQGDLVADQVVKTAATSVGSIIGLLINVLDPQRVVVGGGLGSADGLYWQWLESSTRQHIWSKTHRHLPIVQGKFGPLAAMMGAAIVAQEHVK
jgi:glucokinase